MTMPGPALSRRAFTLSAAAFAAAAAGCGRIARTSPSAEARAAAVTLPLPNVQVSHDVFTGHIEPWVAVNPRQPANLVAVSRVVQGAALGLASYASFDGGASWRSNGLLPGITPDYDANATVAFDTAGTCFACGLAGNRKQEGNVLVWRSQDGGRTFQPPLTAVTGYLDHPSLAVGPASQPGPGYLYLAGTFYNSTHNGLAFTRSADGGRSFEPPAFPDPVTGAQGILPVTAAGPGGAVHIMYVVPSLATRSGLVKIVTSADYGATFAAPASLPLSIVAPPAPGGVITRCGPALATAPDDSGVYAVIATYDTATSESKIQLCHSADQGRTWNSPVVTVASSRQAIYFEPQAAVGHGRAAISAFALANGKVDVLLFTSRSSRPQFGPPQRVTTQPFNPTLGTTTSGGGTGGPYWLGNYQGIAATPAGFQPIWNDTRTGTPQIFTAAIPNSA
jgi:hypothetical protein